MDTGIEAWQDQIDDVVPASFAYGLLGSATVGVAIWTAAFLLIF